MIKNKTYLSWKKNKVSCSNLKPFKKRKFVYNLKQINYLIKLLLLKSSE